MTPFTDGTAANLSLPGVMTIKPALFEPQGSKQPQRILKPSSHPAGPVRKQTSQVSCGNTHATEFVGYIQPSQIQPELSPPFLDERLCHDLNERQIRTENIRHVVTITLTVGCLGNVHVGTLFCLLFLLFFFMRGKVCRDAS